MDKVSNEPDSLDDRFPVLEGIRDKRQQFIDILNQTTEKGILLSFLVGIAHHLSGGEGSSIQRGSYVFCIAIASFLLKQIFTSSAKDSLIVKIAQRYSTLIFLMIISIAITESTIFQSPEHFAFSPT